MLVVRAKDVVNRLAFALRERVQPGTAAYLLEEDAVSRAGEIISEAGRVRGAAAFMHGYRHWANRTDGRSAPREPMSGNCGRCLRDAGDEDRRGRAPGRWKMLTPRPAPSRWSSRRKGEQFRGGAGMCSDSAPWRWYGGRWSDAKGVVRRTHASSRLVNATGTRRREQARSVLRQAGAAGAEEAVSALSPEVHATRWIHEPDLPRVPENRESRLKRPAHEQTL